MSPSVFWDMTYKELSLAIEGNAEAQKIGISEAWLTAKLFHCNPRKFPSLSKLLNPNGRKLDKQEKESIQNFIKQVEDKNGV